MPCKWHRWLSVPRMMRYLSGTAKVSSCSCAELQPAGSATVPCPDPSALQIVPKATDSQQRSPRAPWGRKHRGPLGCLPASSSSQHCLLTRSWLEAAKLPAAQEPGTLPPGGATTVWDNSLISPLDGSCCCSSRAGRCQAVPSVGWEISPGFCSSGFLPFNYLYSAAAFPFVHAGTWGVWGELGPPGGGTAWGEALLSGNTCPGFCGCSSKGS